MSHGDIHVTAGAAGSLHCYIIDYYYTDKQTSLDIIQDRKVYDYYAIFDIDRWMTLDVK